jgi:hypothetical protein
VNVPIELFRDYLKQRRVLLAKLELRRGYQGMAKFFPIVARCLVALWRIEATGADAGWFFLLSTGHLHVATCD